MSEKSMVICSGCHARLRVPPAMRRFRCPRCQSVQEAAIHPGPPPVAQTAARDAVVTYFDGVNSASCHVQQYGPIWIVVGVGQTMVGCSRGLSAAGEEACPRRTYGVIP